MLGKREPGTYHTGVMTLPDSSCSSKCCCNSASCASSGGTSLALGGPELAVAGVPEPLTDELKAARREKEPGTATIASAAPSAADLEGERNALTRAEPCFESGLCFLG